MATTAKPWARLYDARWCRRRAKQLRLSPLCVFCEQQGIVTAATIADHVVPHRGDPVLFEGALQSLCKPCHDGAKQQLEKSGTLRGVDENGNPLDPRHPWNREPLR